MVKNDKERPCSCCKIFDELSAFSTWITGVNTGDFAPTCWICFADNSSQIFWEERQNCNLALQPWRITTENFRNATLRLKTKRNNMKKPNSDLRKFAHFRAEIGFRRVEKKEKNSLPTRKKTKPVSSWRETIKGKNFDFDFAHFD